MTDLRRVTFENPTQVTAKKLLKAAKLRKGEYLLAFWQKPPPFRGMTSADITIDTQSKLDYIIRHYNARKCAKLGFVVTNEPGANIKLAATDSVMYIYFFGS